MRDMVLVLNFSDTASRAAARKLRAERICCKIVQGCTKLDEILEQAPLGVLLAGGVTGNIPTGLDGQLLSAGIPVLALGDAAAMLLQMLGGEPGDVTLRASMAKLEGVDCELMADLTSFERLIPCARAFELPGDASAIMTAQEVCIGYCHNTLPLYGVQLAMEQNDPEGTKLLCNFALSICGCSTWWDDDAFVSRAVDEIRRMVGDGMAACAMTGGLDSGVTAVLAYKALGARLKCIFVDTGLLRDSESDEFIAFYRDKIGMNITCVDAQAAFLEVLTGVTDAEEKRSRIATLLQAILRDEMQKLSGVNVLIRGTSANDKMGANASRRRPFMPLTVPVLEPVRDLFKDEIRHVGEYLGLPAEVISRQPFPGSGLALRIMGEATVERLKTLRAADAIFRQEIAKSPISKRLWQYFAVLTPMPGQEDQVVISLRAVHASEASMAYAARLPYDVMESVVERMLQELPCVQRVVYDLTPSNNYTGIEWQ